MSQDVAALLRAARRDAPSTAAKERIFAKVAAQTAATAAATPLLAKLLGSVAAKVALAVSVAALLGLVGAFAGPRLIAPPLAPDEPLAARASDEGAGLAAPRLVVALEGRAPAATGATRESTAAPVYDDAMEREARWVAEARTALMRGEPQTAAAKARAARALPSHLLEPEELRILGRALRAMGDDKGADAAFSELVAKYPEEALRP